MSTSAKASVGSLAAASQMRRRRGLLSKVGRPAPQTEADLNQERLWALLEQGTATLKQLRAAGIKSPAQEIYDLQLAGYAIDRLRVPDGPGASTVGYRLRIQTQPGLAHVAPQAERESRAAGMRTAAGSEPC